MTRTLKFLPTAAFVALLIAGCAAGPGQRAVPGGPAPAEMVAAVRAHAVGDDAELAVQPLRDPRVEDLRADAARLEAAGDFAAAAAALDEAMAVVPDDPALMQERAEVALLLGDPALAGSLAERAYALGARVGPLCRRHWATLEQLRLGEGDAAGAASASEQIRACRVTGPVRY